ncbi:MAG: hypothetical protein ACKOUM_05390 [Sphingopyxis sp.]
MSPTQYRFGQNHRFGGALALLVSGAAIAMPQAALAAGTRAGTLINNTASATYDQGAGPVSVNSNTVTLKVDELIDTTVAWGDASDVPTSPNATSQVLTFEITNTGNGVETFSLATLSTIGGDNYDPTVNSIVIDNGNGVYDPGVDTVYVAGSGNPVLNPDQTLTVFVLSTTPNAVSDGNRGGVRLTATSTTGTGAPGTSFAGQGEGGGNAVLGTTGGDGSDNGYYQVASATVALVKSATILDPLGGTAPIPGAVITYSIVASTSGSGNLPNLTINDAVPTGTTYRAGSITLGATALTDAADADAGTFASNNVAVALGTVPGGQTRTVTFKVVIN